MLSSDGLVDCARPCSLRYPRGTRLRLTAKPAANYLFVRWSGDCIGVAPICDVALDRSTSVRAIFVGEPVVLVVSVGGPGKVTSVPAGLDCGGAAYACLLTAPYASNVTLSPIPDSTGRFGAWDGPCSSAGLGACTVRLQNPRTETAAAFGHSSPQSGEQPLTVTPYDSLVQVTSQPAGIDCPPACMESFPSGTVVTLRLNRGLWQPACRGEDLARCTLVLDAPTEVGVAPPPPPPPLPVPRRDVQVQVTVSGSGLVRSADGRILCGWSSRPRFRCSARFLLGRGNRIEVPLSTKAGPHARFARWGGSCRGAKPTCKLRIVGRDPEAFPVTALFRVSR